MSIDWSAIATVLNTGVLFAGVRVLVRFTHRFAQLENRVDAMWHVFIEKLTHGDSR